MLCQHGYAVALAHQREVTRLRSHTFTGLRLRMTGSTLGLGDALAWFAAFVALALA